MDPNASQVHSHFRSCTCAGVMNVQSLGWKGKKKPNWAPKTPLEGLEMKMPKMPSHCSFIFDMHEL